MMWKEFGRWKFWVGGMQQGVEWPAQIRPAGGLVAQSTPPGPHVGRALRLRWLGGGSRRQVGADRVNTG
jgi:hypothetical protein